MESPARASPGGETRLFESFSPGALSHTVNMQNFEGSQQALIGEDDLLLVDRVLAGDRRAFAPLVRRHERRVFRVTLAILGNVEDVEEAMQDAFLKAFRHLDQFRKDARFTTWLTRIAVNSSHEMMLKKEGMGDKDPNDPMVKKMCTENCVKMGGKYVLFDAASKTIYELDDQSKLEQFAGQKVTVTGRLEGHEDNSRDSYQGSVAPRRGRAPPSPLLALIYRAAQRTK